MESGFDHAAYSTILFMDSMVALEGRPLRTLPWHEIDAAGPILVLVVPQVNAEIDKRKRDGRLSKRAREFNRLIGPAAEAASPTRISDGPPAVDIAVASCDRIEWDVLDDLDPEEGDARVVAQILYARDVPRERRLLLSHDINPIAIASRHGLKARKMPDHWLQEPEPSPSERELMRLKGRVNELEATQPEFDANIVFGADEPLQLYQVQELSNEERNSLFYRVLSQNPKQQQHRPPFATVLFEYDDEYDEKYTSYKESSVPRYVASVHRYIEAHFSQIPFSVRPGTL